MPATAADNNPVNATPDDGSFFGILSPEFKPQDSIDLTIGLGTQGNAFLTGYRFSFPGAQGLRIGSESIKNGANYLRLQMANREPNDYRIFFIDEEFKTTDLELLVNGILTPQNSPHCLLTPFPGFPVGAFSFFVDSRNVQAIYLGAPASVLVELEFTNRLV